MPSGPPQDRAQRDVLEVADAGTHGDAELERQNRRERRERRRLRAESAAPVSGSPQPAWGVVAEPQGVRERGREASASSFASPVLRPPETDEGVTRFSRETTRPRVPDKQSPLTPDSAGGVAGEGATLTQLSLRQRFQGRQASRDELRERRRAQLSARKRKTDGEAVALPPGEDPAKPTAPPFSAVAAAFPAPSPPSAPAQPHGENCARLLSSSVPTTPEGQGSRRNREKNVSALSRQSLRTEQQQQPGSHQGPSPPTPPRDDASRRRRSSRRHGPATDPSTQGRQLSSKVPVPDKWGRIPNGAMASPYGLRVAPPEEAPELVLGIHSKGKPSGGRSLPGTDHRGPTNELFRRTGKPSARSAALEEELELLNAEDLDVTTFARSDHARIEPATPDLMSSGEHSRQIQQVVEDRKWGDGLDRYPAVSDGSGASFQDFHVPAPVQTVLLGGSSASERDSLASKAHSYAEPSVEKLSIDEPPAVTTPLARTPTRTPPSPGDPLLQVADIREHMVAAGSRNSFVHQPGSRSGMIQLFIKRIKGLYGQYPAYECYTEQGHTFLMAARRRKKSTTSHFVISLEQNDVTRGSEAAIAKLKSNYVGTEYIGSNSGEKRSDQSSLSSDDRDDVSSELLAVRYKQTVMSRTGGPRNMSVIFREPSSLEVPDRGLVEVYKGAKVGKVTAKEEKSTVILRNKKPVWDDEVGGFVLDFQGRVSEASVKNFQLAQWTRGEDDPDGAVICQFGRTGPDTFALDYSYPLSALQAFMISLSSMDIKLCYSM
mmetsp:Transcript_37249/g.105100  ORF Transcript_37249/g.105100 Transcript_37249/m.105100 type:complete len:774 (-) Transcript_37249:196-2517(-)|eukprot:CAMPEP_0117656670 /NCGR_PEP_ID=MMETSP0804-20121206/4927_1 /TAXON_ID=1074897 /ORGANISM="Tetraselmis astigmatica, Strain CCMP880" /LENGTH=773 /DNA_ID=CAMNT_0005463085 /DNA_START=369 /DNA_END=2690 /DNA_ORIENTATION=+